MIDIKTVGTDELRQRLANAFVTASQALGHSKTTSNVQMVERYREELVSRGEKVPSLGLFDGDDEYKHQLYEQGQFNGPGSQ
jgi:hypothetical protein